MSEHPWSCVTRGWSEGNSFSSHGSYSPFFSSQLSSLELFAAAPFATLEKVVKESVGYLPVVTLSHSGVGLWFCLQQPEEVPSWAERRVGAALSPLISTYWDPGVSR